MRDFKCYSCPLTNDPDQLARNCERLAELEDEGIEIVGIPQTVKHLSDPMKWIYPKVRAGVLHHDNNPVLTWMASDVTARIDHNDNIFPNKERPDNKIDGIVALIMAMHLALNAPEELPMDLEIIAI